MDQQALEYFQRRERLERAAAKSAACLQARRVHQELAEHYALLLQRKAEMTKVDAPLPRSRLTMVSQSDLRNA